MLLKLNDKPLADFTQPIEMMKDCHRRIEHFLHVLRAVDAQAGQGDLTSDSRRALEAALNYFAHFAPRHTADEEESLFPRICASEDPDAAAVAAELDRLRRDHRRGEACHQRVEELVRQWLTTGQRDDVQRTSLRMALDELAAMYDAHIRLEEQRIFVLASHILDSKQVREIGREMKLRRSLNTPSVEVTRK